MEESSHNKKKKNKFLIYIKQNILYIGLAVIALAIIIGIFVVLTAAAPVKSYDMGDFSMKSITKVVGNRKLESMETSTRGDGFVNESKFVYKGAKTPLEDINEYTLYLETEFGFKVTEENENIVSLSLANDESKSVLSVDITPAEDGYTVVLKNEVEKEPVFPTHKDHNISPEEAREIMLSLTRRETGFLASIDVYTLEMSSETVVRDNWEYYVFDVIADYSATHIEHRGTFYVSCDDGMVLRYNAKTDETDLIRKSRDNSED